MVEKCLRKGLLLKLLSMCCCFSIMLTFFSYEGIKVEAMDINIALNKTATANVDDPGGTAAMAVNGDVNDGWYGEGQSSYWLKVDLGGTIDIGRWVVKHAQSNGDLAVYNTKDFKLQVSNDGSTFTDVDIVTGNTESITDRNVSASGRYVRIYITQGAQDGQPNCARIREFEIYGSVNTPPTQGSNGNPRVVTTTYATSDVPIASYVVTDSPYNADSSGVIDATGAIQGALNDCYNSGGGVVWMPVGKYRVTASITIPSHVELRGDWQDPDLGTSYGTVIVAEVPSGGRTDPGLFRIGGSAGVKGLTVFYPNQNINNPVPYPYTFEIAGRALGEESYMNGSVQDCTMLNSYYGISVGLLDCSECHTIRNVRGTVLKNGLILNNFADVGRVQKVKFLNTYWASAGAVYSAPNEADIDTWTRGNAIGIEVCS